jgi:pimeloyl-ACP methyl ester carboxylesterase
LQHQKDFKILITNAEFNCKVLGNGPINIIAFHGFGQNANAYLPCAIQNPEYTIFSFDLPYHGDTIIQKSSYCLSPYDVTELIQKLLNTRAIERFSLMAFSIGSKLLFPILEKYPARIEKVWLLAPDGIKLNSWYRAATGSQLMRNIFKRALKKYRLLKGLGNILKSMHIVDESTLLFAMKSINTEKKREQVYAVWTYLRELKLNIEEVSNKLNQSNIPIYFIMGERDKIIKPSKVEPLLQKLQNSKTISLSCGHQRLIEYFADWNSKNSK